MTRLRRALPWLAVCALVGAFLLAAAQSGTAEASRSLRSLDHVEPGEEYVAGDIRWRIDTAELLHDSVVDEYRVVVHAHVTNLGHVPLDTSGISDTERTEIIPIITWGSTRMPVRERLEFEDILLVRSEIWEPAPLLNPHIAYVLDLEVGLGAADPDLIVGKPLRVYLTASEVTETTTRVEGYVWNEPSLAAFVDLTISEGRDVP